AERRPCGVVQSVLRWRPPGAITLPPGGSMFPLKDDNPTEIFPILTLAIIAACGAAWVLLQGAGLDESVLVDSVCALGAIPAEITRGAEGVVPLGPGYSCTLGGFTWEALFTSMFLHGSWMHLLG